MNNRRALVIEDDETSRQVIARILGKLGIDSDVCQNGAEGLYFYLRDPSYILVLLDLMMPEVDGYTLLQIVENLFERGILHGDPRIIVQSGAADLTTFATLINYRCVYAVRSKPLHVDEIVRDIECLTGRRTSEEVSSEGCAPSLLPHG